MFLNKISDKLVFNFLSKIDYGYLEIKTFDGELLKFGNQEEPLSANIIIKKPNLFQKYSYLYNRLEFTGMWANKLVKGEVHPPHTHSNNIFSGVYYLEGGSQIQFFDPRPQASVLHPNLKYSNFDNSGMIGFNSSKGYGLIFPSWLQHWVNTTDKTRISISWNILLRGDYGQPNTLQNSHI